MKKTVFSLLALILVQAPGGMAGVLGGGSNLNVQEACGCPTCYATNVDFKRNCDRTSAVRRVGGDQRVQATTTGGPGLRATGDGQEKSE